MTKGNTPVEKFLERNRQMRKMPYNSIETPPAGNFRFIGAIHPLKTEIKEMIIPPGMNISEILKIVQPDPTLLQDAWVSIDGIKIPAARWETTYPEKNSIVAARIIPYLRGGGGGGKSILRTILFVALSVAILGPLAPFVGGALGLSGTVATLVGGALVGIAGSLVINAIAPLRPPEMNALSGGGATSPALFIEGGRNRAHPFQPIPSVLGFYRFHPPLGAKTYTESFADHNVFRMLLLIGLGPLEFSDWTIGNTPIENFGDYTLEERSGMLSDAPLNSYPAKVDQSAFSIKLTVVGGFHVRVSSGNADELSVDIAFPSGLVLYHENGDRGGHTIVLTIEYRIVGSSTWLDIPSPTTTFGSNVIIGSLITLHSSRSGAVRHGIRWITPTRGQYEVRLSRLSPEDTEGEPGAAPGGVTLIDKVYWATLRTFTNEDPITLSTPVAKASLVIRATDQLSGTLDQVSVMVRSIVLDWHAGLSVWRERISNNPASLFRHVLQGPGKAIPLSDDEIDIERLQEWHEFCEESGFTFNMIRDFNTSIFNVLSDIAAAGRAGLDIADGKWSIVIDKPVTITTTYINPRNSTDFEAERLFEEVPHAWRIRFPNEDTNFKQDTRTVYRDGYSETNAFLYSQMEFPGVTNADHVWKLGQYYAAVAVQRPERWTVTQDFESLIVRRGMRVKLAHDVMLVGLSYGRIADIVVGGAGNISQIITDEDLPMVTGKNYSISVRRDVYGDVAITSVVATIPGTSRRAIPLLPSIPEGMVKKGDLFIFGEFGKESEDALVLSVVPQSDFTAQITLIPYRGNEIYGADSGVIPPYTPTVTADVFLPIVEVENVNSNDEIYDAGVGDTARVVVQIAVRPIPFTDVYLDVQQRLSGTNEQYSNSEYIQFSSAAIKIIDIIPGETLDFRVRWNHELLIPGKWAYISNNTIIGLNRSPEYLLNMTIRVITGLAVVTWDSPGLSDLITRGIARFRHSSNIIDPTWAESTAIGETPARSLTISLPLKDGTYLAKIFDRISGLSSKVVYLGVVQASVLTFVNLDSINEHPTYSGIHHGTVADPRYSILKLTDFIFVDDFTPVDGIYWWDSEGGIIGSGIYDFAFGFDFGTVRGVRLTTRVTATSITVQDRIDEKFNLIDTWEDFDGVDQAESDIQIWVRYTNDDPTSSTTWSEFEKLSSSEFRARGFDFEARLTTNSSAVNIYVTRLGIDADVVL